MRETDRQTGGQRDRHRQRERGGTKRERGKRESTERERETDRQSEREREGESERCNFQSFNSMIGISHFTLSLFPIIKSIYLYSLALSTAPN